MQASKDRGHVQDAPDVFRGLTEKDLVSVYNIGKIRKLNPGEVFIREGDTDRTVYVVLEGSVRIEKKVGNLTEEIAILPRSSCVGEIAFARDARRTASASAVDPVTVMALDEQGFNTLAPAIRSVIFRNLGELAVSRAGELDVKVSELSGRNKYLIAYLKDRFTGNNSSYEKSDMIRQVLKGFPRLPMYATKLTELLLDDRTSTEEVIECARTDPSLVGIVLKTANSPFYNLPGKVSDFQHAILLLGFNQIYQVILDNGIKNIMPRKPEFNELQFHSLLVSVMSFELGLLCGMKKPLITNTLGILHGIGKSIILLLKEDYPGMGVLLDMLDDARLGALLMREWKLPEGICLGIEYHYYPEFVPPEEIPLECREGAAILHLAHLCVDRFAGNRQKEAHSPFMSDYMRLLGLWGGAGDGVSQLVDRMVPSLQKKMDLMPEAVRTFLARSGLIRPSGQHGPQG
jgi:HD-like signal output (HDOD) protein